MPVASRGTCPLPSGKNCRRKVQPLKFTSDQEDIVEAPPSGEKKCNDELMCSCASRKLIVVATTLPLVRSAPFLVTGRLESVKQCRKSGNC